MNLQVGFRVFGVFVMRSLRFGDRFPDRHIPFGGVMECESIPGFRVYGLGFRIHGLGFRV